MGSYQTKCQCGEFSTIEVIASCSQSSIPKTNDRFGFSYVAKHSGYRGWSSTLSRDGVSRLKAYPCDACARVIGDKLDLVDDLDYTMKREATGWWRTDLP